MELKEKPRYNMVQNVVFMVKTAWRLQKGVPVLTVMLAVLTTAQTTMQLFLAPEILRRLETSAPLRELLTVIAVFGLALVAFSGLYSYLDTNKLYGRIAVRTELVMRIERKHARTSYPNLMDTEFLRMEARAQQACNANSKPAEYIWTTLTELLANLMGLAVYLLLLTGLKPGLLLVVTGTTAANFFLSRRILSWGYRHREEEAEYMEQMRYLSDVATGRQHAKDIRIFGLREWLDDVWNRTLRLYEAFLFKRERIYIWANIAELSLAFLRNGIACAWLLGLALSEGMSASEFLLYFGAVSGFGQWVTGIMDKLSELHRQSLELSVLREFYDWPESFRFEGGETLDKKPDMACELKLENVSFRYPGADHDTLSHVNLTVRPGEKLAVVGMNGAGKTTMVKLLCGFLDPTEGRVLLNGEDIRRFNRRDYYNLFSAVFQEFSVLEANVAENVAQRVDGFDEERVWQCLRRAGLEEAVQQLPEGIHTKLGRRIYEDGVELSGGQNQRLMLARALYKDGPILVLDEPTAALDPIAENDIYMKYSEMTSGRTSIFISHRLASTRFCDRILFIKDGGIAEEGTHESLLALNGGYARLFEIQSQYYREGGENHGE